MMKEHVDADVPAVSNFVLFLLWVWFNNDRFEDKMVVSIHVLLAFFCIFPKFSSSVIALILAIALRLGDLYCKMTLLPYYIISYYALLRDGHRQSSQWTSKRKDKNSSITALFIPTCHDCCMCSTSLHGLNNLAHCSHIDIRWRGTDQRGCWILCLKWSDLSRFVSNLSQVLFLIMPPSTPGIAHCVRYTSQLLRNEKGFMYVGMR